jgi:hypothetical protein
MEQFKIDFYEDEFGPNTFPDFRRLTEPEMRHVRDKIKESLGLSNATSGLELLRAIRNHSCLVPGVNPNERNFDLKSLIDWLKVPQSGAIFVNWYRFDDMEKFRLTDFCNVFHDVWYPPADEAIELVDSQLRWIIFVAHWGVIRVLRL